MNQKNFHGSYKDPHKALKRALDDNNIAKVVSIYCHYHLERDTKAREDWLTSTEWRAVADFACDPSRVIEFLEYNNFFLIMREFLYIVGVSSKQYELGLIYHALMCEKWEHLQMAQEVEGAPRDMERNAISYDKVQDVTAVERLQLVYVSIVDGLLRKVKAQRHGDILVPFALQENLFEYRAGRDHIMERAKACANETFIKTIAQLTPLAKVKVDEGFVATVNNRWKIYEKGVTHE